MAGTRVNSGPQNKRKNGPGGIFKDKSDKKTSPKERLSRSEVTFGKFIDKRSGK